MPGCLNDINVVEYSPLVTESASVQYTISYKYKINKVRRNKPFWFADQIYPNWPVFMQTMPNPVSREIHFISIKCTRVQKGIRKDSECAFGVLQVKLHIFAHASRFMTLEALAKIVR